MKIFNEWKENDVSSFIVFLARETRRHKAKMREYNSKLKDGDPEIVYMYHLQQGMAAEADMIYTLAKMTFNFDKRKEKSEKQHKQQ